MLLDYVIADPTGNITVLVLSPVPREMQSTAANYIMSTIGGEQVGFVEKASLPGAAVRLQMMGGEFCGNASISAAALLAQSSGRNSGDYLLEVSGCESAVPCRIEARPDGLYGTVSMPLPLHIASDAVSFPGITHQIVPAEAFPDSETASQYARSRCAAADSEAFGLLLWDSAGGFMRPCVYVAATDSAVWECGCASGSAAMGVYLSLADGQPVHNIRQPGGVISVRCETEEGCVRGLSVTGGIKLTKRGTLSVSL